MTIADNNHSEATQKQMLRVWFRDHRIWAFWPVQMGLGEAALDCYACKHGQFIGIEVKKLVWVPSDFTTRQLLIMQDLLDHGANVAFGNAVEIVDQIGFHRWMPIPQPKRRK